MSEIQISNDTIEKVKAFKQLIDVILAIELEDTSDYVELICQIGMEKMLYDVFPEKEEDLLRKTMVQMFNENPNFVADFVSRRIQEGEEIQLEREMWNKYIKDKE